MDKGQVILYQTPDGESKIEVRLENDTVWLSADQMAELFQRNKSTISRHVKNVLEDGELEEASTVAFFATVQHEGDRKVERKIAFYNLDMIISVGYRVHSHRGVQFRIWATKVLKDWINILDDFLRISRKDILTHAGKISAKLAKEKANKEYDKFKERTMNELSPVEIHFLENFEREQKKLLGGKGSQQ